MKQLFNIHTEQTNEGGERVLSLRIGERYVSFAVTDKIGSELHSLAYYTLEEVTAESLSDIFANHDELHHGFYEVQVSYDQPASVLVPFQYHNTHDAKTILDTMYGRTVQASVISEVVGEWELYNIYAIPSDIQDWVNRKFPGHKYRHNYTLGISTIPSSTADRMLLDFNTDEFSFIALRDNKILIAQTLSYTTPEDILYYLLKTCNQFSLSREEVQLIISGLIEKESQLFRELYQYFLYADFREPTWSLPPNGNPSHFFTSLNDLARCAS